MSTHIVLSSLIKKYNLNALELEKLTGVPASTIYRLLKADGNPTIEVLKKLAAFFLVTVSQLIGEEPLGCKQIPLVPANELMNFFNGRFEERIAFPTISLDFPVNSQCFATRVQDESMEPYLSKNSIIIIDSERPLQSKDFVLLVKPNDKSYIRQVIGDGENHYLKMLSPDYPSDLRPFHREDYFFIGVIVHYRTNLYDLNDAEIAPNPVLLKRIQEMQH